MGLKQFNQDLKAVAADNIQYVTDVRKGDSDGEIVFTYTVPNENDANPIEIQALATDADSYPHSDFLIFTPSDHVGLSGWLQDIAAQGSVMQVITLIARKLTAKFTLQEEDHGEEEQADDDGEDEEINDDSAFDTGSDGYSSGDDEESQIDIDPLPSRRPATTYVAGFQGSMLRLKRHLRQVHREGFHLSVPFANKADDSSGAGIFSVSIRVSKLGIPDEALEAWDLTPSDYVVLLVKLPMGYPDESDFVRLGSDQSTVQFKVGKCAGPRPSYQVMRRTFDLDNEDPEEKDENHADLFVPLYMSASLDSLLNREFPSLLRLRRSEGFSWDQAQAFKFEQSRGNHHQKAFGASSYVEEEQNGLGDWFDLEFLRRDYISAGTEGEDGLNLIIVAMQFTLQRLVKCTKYCMVCHQKTDDGFGAVKPFVCSNLLCLYQYLSLGFGQSIEHEIVNNPYVVDLLISFFYSASCNKGLREFPQGLGLKWADTGSLRSPSPHLEAEVLFTDKTIKFNATDYASYRHIREGHYVMLVIKGMDISPSTSCIMNGGLERHTCIIDSINGTDYTFRIVATQTSPVNLLPPLDASRQTQLTHPSSQWVKVMVFKHDTDVDELENGDRERCLMLMTHTIPSVLDMRKYLLGRPGRRLSSWRRMDSSTLALLNWIVASNRSFIVQDAAVPDGSRNPTAKPFHTPLANPVPSRAMLMPSPNAALNPLPIEAGVNDESTTESDSPNLVQGMEAGWMQFRFAQGSPEKEQVFVKELTKLNEPGGQRHHPSLFAWHGSRLENWHSIIRTGLDFSTTLNGRAYGNGVYFSKDFYTSQGYSTRSLGAWSVFTWPNSQLRVSNAISICELVNEPSKFVSTNPHFVVDKIEWIQCRYLFVQVQPSAEAIGEPFPKTQRPLSEATRSSPKMASGYLDQDPNHRLMGNPNKSIKIPVSAIPASRRYAVDQPQLTNGLGMTWGATKENPIVLDGVDDDIYHEIDHDLDGFLASDEDDNDEGGNQMVRKRRRTSTDSGLGEQRPSKLTTAIQDSNNPGQLQAVKTTPFQAGALDLNSLPKLIEPTWASSSPGALRALNREIKDLQKAQSKSDLTSLGWYIDFEKLNNLFHWIVELHSFDNDLPLAQDMKRAGCSSVVLELRFGASYPLSPPFVRVIRPRFLTFAQGGGGHVTAGGAICSELLTNSGWSPALSLEKVFLQVRLNICDVDPPARLEKSSYGRKADYNVFEAVDAFRRAATSHGWQIPSDIQMITTMASQLN
ncbi:hypothetical protein ACJ41O_011608 [Fusarium nematophilum]